MKSFILLLAAFAVAIASPLGQQGTFGEGPACPIDDPLTIEPGNINVTLPPFLVIDEGSTQGGGVATGLSTLFYSYTINLLTLRIDFQLSITGTACARGDDYEATGTIDAVPFRPVTIPSGPFQGSGAWEGCVSEFSVRGYAVLLVNLITNRLSIRTLSITTLSFSSLSANASQLVVGGNQIDWVVWNRDIKSNFDEDWSTHRLEITEKARLSANQELRKYTLQDFLDLIGEGTSPAPCTKNMH